MNDYLGVNNLIITDLDHPTCLESVLTRYPDKAYGAVEALNKLFGINGLTRTSHVAAIYLLATQYNKAGASFVEIGTNNGRTACAMALAAPLARITTLDADPNMTAIARQHVSGYTGYANIWPVTLPSWEALSSYQGISLDLVFVDGDHDLVERDMPWWNNLRPGGLMLFHDYDEGFPEVVRCVDLLAARMGRSLDVLVRPDGGLAGLYKRKGDPQW